jgi:DNA-binding Xre family transcriptional regulator
MRVEICIRDLAKRNGIESVYRLARRLNVTDTRARQLWNSEDLTSISVKTIALICETFECTPNDFIIVKKGKRKA